MSHILAIDQGTTSSRAIVFDDAQRIVAQAQEEFPQHYPASGWVEHDAEDLWATVLRTARAALERAGGPGSVAAIGITNQRETTLLWDRDTGRAVHPAIVWQDRRTAAFCEAMRADGHEALLTERTGLVLDPYFSASKLAWLLNNVAGARAAAEAGRLAFGTVDSFLLWRLTGGRVHATDATNAARTALLNIRTGDWDGDLLRLFRIPRAILPRVTDCAGDLGTTDAALFGAPIAIRGSAGDQQAATVGQACFQPGMLKATYGTGCFALLNTGDTPCVSRHRMLSTIAYQLGGQRTYALEGAIFIAGAAVQWLRDELKLIATAPDSGRLAAQADPAQRVYLVPAFVGLGAPWWDAEARGAMFGLTRATGPAEFARAALESVCFQTLDLLDAMHADWPQSGAGTVLRADGGMVASDWTMQRLADLIAAPVDRPEVLETTALGAAWLAGQAAGVWPDAAAFAARWRLQRRFTPALPDDQRGTLVDGWRDAVRRTRSAYAA